jgi:hypothetical protein
MRTDTLADTLGAHGAAAGSKIRKQALKDIFLMPMWFKKN